MDSLFHLANLIAAELLGAIRNVLGYLHNSNQRVFWLYLVTSLLFAGLVYVSMCRRQNKQPAIGDFVHFCFPGRLWQHPSARLDVRFFFVGQLIHGLVFAGLSGFLVLTFQVASDAAFNLVRTHQLLPVSEHPPGLAMLLLMGLVTAMAIDFVSYWLHVLQHKSPLLWEFHKIHHSATAMHPLSNYREHIIDNLLYVPFLTLTAGLLGGVFQACYADGQELALYILGIPVVAFLFNFFGYNLRHSHIWLAWPPLLGRIFGSPANHQIHHSRERRHMDKNFGFIFALWDWMFGTLYLPPRQQEEFAFGLADGSHDEYDGVVRLYTLPFIKLYSKYKRKRRPEVSL